MVVRFCVQHDFQTCSNSLFFFALFRFARSLVSFNKSFDSYHNLQHLNIEKTNWKNSRHFKVDVEMWRGHLQRDFLHLVLINRWLERVECFDRWIWADEWPIARWSNTAILCPERIRIFFSHNLTFALLESGKTLLWHCADDNRL